jgi:hypothetical protein
MPPLSGLSAGGPITLGPLRIKMRLGRGDRCLVTVCLAPAATAVSPTPSTRAVYRQPTHRPAARRSCCFHDGCTSTVADPRYGAVGARLWPEASLPVAPPTCGRRTALQPISQAALRHAPPAGKIFTDSIRLEAKNRAGSWTAYHFHTLSE